MSHVEGCPGYWCRDNSCHSYCGQHIKQQSPKLFSLGYIYLSSLVEPFLSLGRVRQRSTTNSNSSSFLLSSCVPCSGMRYTLRTVEVLKKLSQKGCLPLIVCVYAYWTCIFLITKWSNFFSPTLYGCLLSSLEFLSSINHDRLIIFFKNVKI